MNKLIFYNWIGTNQWNEIFLMKDYKKPTSEKGEKDLQFGSPMLADISIPAQSKELDTYIEDAQTCLDIYARLKADNKFGRKKSPV